MFNRELVKYIKIIHYTSLSECNGAFRSHIRQVFLGVLQWKLLAWPMMQITNCDRNKDDQWRPHSYHTNVNQVARSEMTVNKLHFLEWNGSRVMGDSRRIPLPAPNQLCILFIMWIYLAINHTCIMAYIYGYIYKIIYNTLWKLNGILGKTQQAFPIKFRYSLHNSVYRYIFIRL